ncbi:MAG TPA: thiamine pyrophosphate-dependent dehydrogenase E1 component subunit alpha [Quisquiliibacterium sp.]|nr:thiamine pyrophosphate-dependent dehydrogenase E1 component subunit alpha [Quisquiliibacterium sp.]
MATRRKTSADVERLASLYETMLLIRCTEGTLSRIFADGEVPGFIHLSIGQEAVAAGVASALQPQDTLATTHRGHGHVLARGLDLEGFFKEIMGRDGGVCRGRGGSMHVSDMNLGIIGANGIVGAGIPIAVGSALALKTLSTRGVAVSMFGDGAMAEGVLHESLNLAALWKLPVLFVCENNGWSEFSPTREQFAASLDKLAAAFGLPHTRVDGNDVLAVADAAARLVAEQRDGGGARVLECSTHRVRGHFEGDPQKYRPADELKADAQRDPLERAAAALRAAGFGEPALERLSEQVEARVAAALAAARADALPRHEDAIADVYTVASGRH